MKRIDDTRIISTYKECEKLSDDIISADIVSVDTETPSKRDHTLVALNITTYRISEPHSDVYLPHINNYFVPVRMRTTKNTSLGSKILVLESLMLHEHLVFHNASFDLKVINKEGFYLHHDPDDTLILANLIDEYGEHGLKALVKRHFGYQMKEFKELAGTGKKQIPFYDLDPLECAKYGRDDSYYTLQLYFKLIKMLPDSVLQLYETIEKPLIRIVADMHRNGIYIDKKKLKEINNRCTREITKYDKQLKKLMPEVENYNSSKQVREFFIMDRGMPIIKRSHKTNAPSVDVEVLNKYAEVSEEAKILLKYRKVFKISSTFIPALTPDESGKIYTTFNQCPSPRFGNEEKGTVTGRFSTSNPNMQNCKKEDKYLDKAHTKPNPEYLGLRECIIADPGHVLIDADYGQMEMRLAAHFSKDEALCKVYIDNLDLHDATAKGCKCNRRKAKTINFGVLYDMQKRTLAKRIKTDENEAQEYIDRFWGTYHTLYQYMKDQKELALTQGYVETLYKRRRHVRDDFNDLDHYAQEGHLRSIFNTIIQGSGGDICKYAMVITYPHLKEIGARIILQIHDELLISCPKNKVKECKNILQQDMLKPCEIMIIPMDVDVKVGKNWMEAH